jgi:hypothetical protein
VGPRCSSAKAKIDAMLFIANAAVRTYAIRSASSVGMAKLTSRVMATKAPPTMTMGAAYERVANPSCQYSFDVRSRQRVEETL